MTVHGAAVEIVRLEPGAARIVAMLRRANAAAMGPQAFDAARRAFDAVRERGDGALIDYTAQYDGVALTPGALVVSRDEISAARDEIPVSLRGAMTRAIARVRAFNERLRPVAWQDAAVPGMLTAVQYSPLAGVGIYVPSGKGRFPSTGIMLVVPAQVAGVRNISVLVPPRPDGRVDPALLVACDLLGVERLYRCNGVAGIAALALGTETITAVPAVVGPGNPYVVAAQMLAQLEGVRMLAQLGPTEAVVLADASADPRRVALDLLTEAEHGTDSAAILVTDSAAVARGVATLLPDLAGRLPEPRRTFAAAALTGGGGIVLAPSLDDAISFVNRYAPEHLQIAMRDAAEVAKQIHHAGEILLGQHTPFSAGNYAIGVPAALPTGGTAAVTSGVTVLSFLKMTSVAGLDAAGLAAVRPIIEALGEYEGFPGHVMAVTER